MFLSVVVVVVVILKASPHAADPPLKQWMLVIASLFIHDFKEGVPHADDSTSGGCIERERRERESEGERE